MTVHTIEQVAQEVQSEVWAYWRAGETRIEVKLVVDTITDFAIRLEVPTDELPVDLRLLYKKALAIKGKLGDQETIELSELISPLNGTFRPIVVNKAA